jgi:hypothetical protein
MPAQSAPSRALTAARWPVGVLVTSWAYIWRTTPMHRRELEGALDRDGPPALPAGVSLDGVQRPEDGAGPLLRRRYRARIRETSTRAAELMARVSADPDQVAPGELAKFRKTSGDEGVMRVGDEFLVRMPGPWDGPIRVVEVTPTSFRFATLDGHLEAGQIEWRARDEDDGLLAFEIESWARSGDAVSHLLHNHLRMAKEVQLHMWTSVLERVARLAGGRLTGGIDIETHRADFPE